MREAPAVPANLGQELEEVALNLPAIQLEGVVAMRRRFGVVAVQRPVASMIIHEQAEQRTSAYP